MSSGSDLDADHGRADAQQERGAAGPRVHRHQLLPSLGADALGQEREPDQVLRHAADMYQAQCGKKTDILLRHNWTELEALTCAVASVMAEMPNQLCVPAHAWGVAAEAFAAIATTTSPCICNCTGQDGSVHRRAQAVHSL